MPFILAYVFWMRLSCTTLISRNFCLRKGGERIIGESKYYSFRPRHQPITQSGGRFNYREDRILQNAIPFLSLQIPTKWDPHPSSPRVFISKGIELRSPVYRRLIFDHRPWLVKGRRPSPKTKESYKILFSFSLSPLEGRRDERRIF